VVFVTFSALKDALNKTLRDILKPIYFIVRAVAFVPASAGLEPSL
jgi:hypothetical protein